MTEAELGIAWAAMAAKEGHKRAMPRPDVGRGDPSAHPLAEIIKAMIEGGKRHYEVAAALNLSRSRVTQIWTAMQ